MDFQISVVDKQVAIEEMLKNLVKQRWTNVALFQGFSARYKRDI